MCIRVDKIGLPTNGLSLNLFNAHEGHESTRIFLGLQAALLWEDKPFVVADRCFHTASALSLHASVYNSWETISLPSY